MRIHSFTIEIAGRFYERIHNGAWFETDGIESELVEKEAVASLEEYLQDNKSKLQSAFSLIVNTVKGDSL